MLNITEHKIHTTITKVTKTYENAIKIIREKPGCENVEMANLADIYKDQVAALVSFYRTRGLSYYDSLLSVPIDHYFVHLMLLGNDIIEKMVQPPNDLDAIEETDYLLDLLTDYDDITAKIKAFTIETHLAEAVAEHKKYNHLYKDDPYEDEGLEVIKCFQEELEDLGLSPRILDEFDSKNDLLTPPIRTKEEYANLLGKKLEPFVDYIRRCIFGIGNVMDCNCDIQNAGTVFQNETENLVKLFEKHNLDYYTSALRNPIENYLVTLLENATLVMNEMWDEIGKIPLVSGTESYLEKLVDASDSYHNTTGYLGNDYDCNLAVKIYYDRCYAIVSTFKKRYDLFLDAIAYFDIEGTLPTALECDLHYRTSQTVRAANDIYLISPDIDIVKAYQRELETLGLSPLVPVMKEVMVKDPFRKKF